MPGQVRRPLGRTRATRLAWTILAAAAITHLYLHLRAGLAFPVPWPDELHFGLPARSLGETGSLRATALHPDRPLMWMPPGYMWLTAPIHALSDAPLSWLRHLSMLAILAGAAGLWRLLCGHASDFGRLGLAAVIAAWLCHPAVLAAGNVARMDALSFALAIWAFVALAHERSAIALALLLLGPLLHPNGLWFLLFGAAFVWRVPPPSKSRAHWLRHPAVIGAALLWMAYAAFAALHFDAFVEDMGIQFGRKAQRDLGAAIWSRHGLRLLLLLAFAFAPHGPCKGDSADARALRLGLAFTLAAWTLARVGHEMWYELFDAWVAAATALFALLWAEQWWMRHSAALAPRLVPIVLAVGATFALLAREAPRLPNEIEWKHMRLPAQSPYVEAREAAAVREAITSKTAKDDAPFRVEPTADLYSLWPPPPNFVDPVRHPFAPSASVLHEAPEHPRHWRKRIRARLDQAREEGHAPQLIYERDAQRRWWWLPAKPSETATKP